MKRKNKKHSEKKRIIEQLNNEINNGTVFVNEEKNESNNNDFNNSNDYIASTSGVIIKCSMIINIDDIYNKKIKDRFLEECLHVKNNKEILVYNYPHENSKPIELTEGDCSKELWNKLQKTIDYGVGKQIAPKVFRLWG